jgi:polyisoprenoid-binding protein YceI
MSATATTKLPTGTWAIDPIHSSIGFGVKHLGVSTFRGDF